mgnify:CR=1 FL=1
MFRLSHISYQCCIYVCKDGKEQNKKRNPSHFWLNKNNILINADKTSKLKWNIVNDTVMGGRSSSRWRDESSTLSFEGFLSLENNGGFASIRHDLNNINLSGTEGIFIKVKGDGRKYQFRIRSQASRWANYSQEFKTKKDTVQTFYLPYKDFKPSWRGRSVRNVPTLTGKDVRGIGFLLGDKIQGKFNK